MLTHTNGAGAHPCRRHIYVASSWRNRLHRRVVHVLRAHGHDVYDFKHPNTSTDRGFRWEDVFLTHDNPADDDPSPPDLASAAEYLNALTHPAADLGFRRDFDAMLAADTFVLVLPCGRSAHLELGWAVGAGKRTAILLDDPCTPELMYKMVDQVATGLDDLLGWLAALPSCEVQR
ncbi:hypothetical protein AWC14_25010 [Mycobacterium kyorinense]|uniref:Nucleoside 2-deoxyribosyltransferase n=2 Tax=Mycobacterium kyorinense TaxID=487514 RepID=A0A1X1Y865_9MYCO|nr:hypothetical protein AWC14_25010 [Mycobacterium kyorinense]